MWVLGSPKVLAPAREHAYCCDAHSCITFTLPQSASLNLFYYRGSLAAAPEPDRTALLPHRCRAYCCNYGVGWYVSARSASRLVLYGSGKWPRTRHELAPQASTSRLTASNFILWTRVAKGSLCCYCTVFPMIISSGDTRYCRWRSSAV